MPWNLIQSNGSKGEMPFCYLMTFLATLLPYILILIHHTTRFNSRGFHPSLG